MNVLFPAVILPGIIFTAMALYPFLEAWATGDKRPHHLLDRPRNAPTRTAIGAMSLSFYILLWIEGGNDIIASTFDLNVFAVTWFMRIAAIAVPPLVFVATKRICLALQRRDTAKLLHGYESGVIKRLPEGKYYEQHQPISDDERAILMARANSPQPIPMPDKYDANGIKQRGYALKKTQAKLSHFFFGEQIPMPTAQEIEEGRHHEAEVTAERDAEIEDSQAKALAPRE
jgi:ubiquinol-cytochrome c reductase cytochrome b subunit